LFSWLKQFAEIPEGETPYRTAKIRHKTTIVEKNRKNFAKTFGGLKNVVFLQPQTRGISSVG
jgi:hypothetical protein